MTGQYITTEHPNGTVETVWTEMDPQGSPPIRSIRVITTQSFFRRLTFNERKVLRTSALDAVADLREDLQRSNFVDLDGVLEQQLLDVTLLPQTRIDELLVDGTPEEA